MKKILFALLLFSSLQLEALPVGNPAQASLFFCEPLCFDVCANCLFDHVSYDVGYYGDFVFNRNLKTVTGKKIDFSRITTNAAYLALHFWNVFDIFTTLGVSKFTFNTSLAPFNSGNRSPRFDFESSTAFSWSVGAHAILFQYRCFTLGAMAQYFSCHPPVKSLFVRANVDDYPDENSHRRYSELQWGMGIAYRYNCFFLPYVAVRWSRLLWEFNNQTFLVTDTLATIPNLRNGKNWGYAIGLTFFPCLNHKLAVTVEGRFVSESAVHVNGLIHF